MFGLLVVATSVVCCGYALYGLKNESIVIRMPDGERVRYDKATQARGFYVSIGCLLVIPVFVLFSYLLNS